MAAAEGKHISAIHYMIAEEDLPLSVRRWRDVGDLGAVVAVVGFVAGAAGLVGA
jgi:hypothetical protein